MQKPRAAERSSRPPSSERIVGPDTFILPREGKHINNLNDYKVVERLGKGAYAKVYLVVNKHTGKEFALKTYPKDYLSKPHRIVNMKNEVAILAAQNHPSIIRLIHYCETKDYVPAAA